MYRTVILCACAVVSSACLGSPCFDESFPVLDVSYRVTTDCDPAGTDSVTIHFAAPARKNTPGWDVQWAITSGESPNLASAAIGGTCDGKTTTPPVPETMILRFWDAEAQPSYDVFCRVDLLRDLDKANPCRDYDGEVNAYCTATVSALLTGTR